MTVPTAWDPEVTARTSITPSRPSGGSLRVGPFGGNRFDAGCPLPETRP
ncbi:MAG: hypothetical protein L3K10_00480 [Thermoplasmata archaeon]|nr:hypothetical protein [Thermoplasmata archaeon]